MSTAEFACSATPTVAARCVRPLATSLSFATRLPVKNFFNARLSNGCLWDF